MSVVRGRIPSLALVSAFALAVLAGCVAEEQLPPEDPGPDTQSAGVAPWAVVALVDTGINPYHVDFRAPAELANVHPSTYIPGYPADIPTVNITLNGTDLDQLLETDKDLWMSLQPGQPYWFRGTRATGVTFGEPSSENPAIFSTGHGSMVASKAAGAAYSLCPTCHIVAVQGFNGGSALWASEQPWIDVQSNSWGPLPAFAWADRLVPEGEPDLNRKFAEAAAQQAVFVASGNGIAGALGVVGFPSPTDSTSGPPGVISVGGHDNGKTTLWTGWFPHVVADACANWAMIGNSVEEYSDSAGGGTSAASPYSAGGATRLILEARRILNASEPRDLEAGVYARAPEGATLPASGPLADGDLTLDELKHTLFHTVSPTPMGDEASGAECSPASPYWTGASWSAVPSQVPNYPWVGYGEVSVASTAFAIDVLEGEADALDRAQADTFYQMDQEVRRTYHGLI